MSQFSQSYESVPTMFAADAKPDDRASFIRKTYFHLAGAVGVIVLLETLLLNIFSGEAIVNYLAQSPYMWLAVLGAFMAVGWIAEKWANSNTSIGMQYAGLGLYVLAEAAIFLPMISIVFLLEKYNPSISATQILATASISTLILFAVMTGIVFVSGADFSFMKGFLAVCGIAAMVAIVASIIFGFSLGIIFSVLMVVFACGYILYYTSNVLHHYQIGQHVAASLALFAALALLFWYVLRIAIYLATSGDD